MTVRLGVVGTGWWATFNHIPVAQDHPDAEVVAIADLNPARLTEVGDRFGIANRYASAEAMLEAETLDGVMVATPHIAHAAPALASLNAGCHVLVEKPMVTTTADAHAVVAAAQAANREVLIPCGWNFRDYTAKAAQWVREGRIGQVEHVVAQMASALEDLFAGEPMIETAEHMYRPPPSTWADPEKAGGYGWGQMSHLLAWVFHVSDLRPRQVHGMAVPSRTGVDQYDAASVICDNGATIALSGSATVPKHRGFQMDVRLFGSEGMIVFDVERERLELARRDGTEETHPFSRGEGAYIGEGPVARFIEICAGKPVENAANAENGARVVETLDAMYRSARSGRTEEV